MEIIETYGLILMGLAVVFGLYMTWGIGANDVANAMGTSVGSGAITVRQAILIAAIFEFAGAIWLMIASARGWPVSTTHSIVGAIIGFAVVGIGVDAVQWGKVGTIAASWVVSPVLGGALAFMLMLSIRRLILNTDNPFNSARRWGPFYIFLVGFIISLVTLFKGLKHLNIDLSVNMSFVTAAIFGIVLAAIGWVMINRVKVDPGADRDFHYASVEKVFTPMMIFTACAMAFAHGSNDVANGIGPLAAVVTIIQSGGEVAQKASLPLWILVLGGAGIVVGLATMGYRVMKTIGSGITQLTPSRGYCATLAAAATVVLASRTGLPVSTTHIAVGAVIGVGLARGVGAIDLRVIGGIIVSWLVTLPVGGILAALFYFTLKGIFT
jgi:PiT family inorganic phosphate transporter